MSKPVLSIESEFDLMVDYQTAIETKSVIVENALNDEHPYSLYAVAEPFPTYDEYMNGDDFDEMELIISSSSLDELKLIQQERTMYA